MSRTDDILDKTMRKEPEAKKWKVVAGIVVGLVFGCMLFVGTWFIISPIIDDYIFETKQIVVAYDILESNEDNTETTVYFIGSSVVEYGIYAEEINRILSEKGYDNITVYNLGISAHFPLERALFIQNVIDANPSLVIIGETYCMVDTSGIIDERIFLVSESLKIRDDSLYLFSNEELKIISENKNPGLFDKKRFLISAIKHMVIKHMSSKSVDKINLDSHDLFIGERFDTEIRGYDYEGIFANPERWGIISTEEDTRAGEAIIYNSKTLSEAGIPVVILNMPLHPFTSATISDDARDYFYNLLNETGSLWYNYEYACPNDNCWNRDGVHLAPYTGAKMFAPQMAELIIELEESNVIHHS